MRRTSWLGQHGPLRSMEKGEVCSLCNSEILYYGWDVDRPGEEGFEAKVEWCPGCRTLLILPDAPGRGDKAIEH